MRKQFLLSVLALTTLIINGYSQGRVEGSVIDGTAKTIASATISLLNVVDSSTVKMGVAEKEGTFSFEGISYGSYIVMISAVGHQQAYSPVFELNATQPTKKLGVIELVPQSKALGAVTIVSRRRQNV